MMKKDADDPQTKKALGLHPGTGPNICQGCTWPKQLCKCPKAGAGSGSPSSSQSSDSQTKSNSASTLSSSNSSYTLSTTENASSNSAMPFSPQGVTSAKISGSMAQSVSPIKQLLKRAKNMGIDPKKLLKNQGIDIEQKDNIAELERLAEKGDKMAKALYLLASENVHNRSKLANKHLSSIKNPFQMKNRKE